MKIRDSPTTIENVDMISAKRTSMNAAKKERAVIDEGLIRQSVLEDRAAERESNAPTSGAGALPDDEEGRVDFEDVRSLVLSFKNVVRIENLQGFEGLTRLQLDNNFLERIENLGHLVNLEWLDISFNKISRIEGLEKLVRLKDLSLFHNQISVRFQKYSALHACFWYACSCTTSCCCTFVCAEASRSRDADTAANSLDWAQSNCCARGHSQSAAGAAREDCVFRCVHAIEYVLIALMLCVRLAVQAPQLPDYERESSVQGRKLLGHCVCVPEALEVLGL